MIQALKRLLNTDIHFYSFKEQMAYERCLDQVRGVSRNQNLFIF